VNVLDVMLLTALAAAVVGGWRLGFAHRLASWAGLAAGLTVAVLSLPRLSEALAPAAPRARLLAVLAFLIGAALCGQAAGLAVGLLVARARGRALVAGGALDRTAGAVLGAAGVLVLGWLTLPALTSATGWPARAARHSLVLSSLERVAPPPPATLRALGRLVADAPYPEVFARVTGAPEAGLPPRVDLPAPARRRAAAAVVRVRGRACEVIQEGTGFLVGPGLVLTNAHVVAGERRTVLEHPGSGPRLATVVAFDPLRDLALLRTDAPRRPVLGLRDAAVGDDVAVFGYPRGGPLRVAPARVAERILAAGTDITRQARSERDVLVIAARLAPGDSGAPLVAPDGRVVGIAFAVDPASATTAYALSVAEIRAFLAELPLPATGTGPCLVGR
jgi:S1-C subfamily serine protease